MYANPEIPSITAAVYQHMEQRFGIEEDPYNICNSYDPFIADSLERINLKSFDNLVYTFPWLSREFCESLVKRYDRAKYSTNPQEPEDSRIPEFIVDRQDPIFAKQLTQMFQNQLAPIGIAVLGQEVSEIKSIQMAIYEADGEISRTSYHVDQDSDATFTVALNDDYEGGGLNLCEGGIYGKTVEVPPQKTGTVSIFNGRAHVHRGMPVTKGVRHLLVFWCSF